MLTPAQQATKLLQLKKATLNDIEIIQDICWMYDPPQKVNVQCFSIG